MSIKYECLFWTLTKRFEHHVSHKSLKNRLMDPPIASLKVGAKRKHQNNVVTNSKIVLAFSNGPIALYKPYRQFVKRLVCSE